MNGKYGDAESAVVADILPRDNEFMRANAKLRKQVIAANLDQVLVVGNAMSCLAGAVPRHTG